MMKSFTKATRVFTLELLWLGHTWVLGETHLLYIADIVRRSPLVQFNAFALETIYPLEVVSWLNKMTASMNLDVLIPINGV